MRTPLQARVDLDVIGQNVSLVREFAGGAEVMAMVKAEAYGHGLVRAARAAVAGGATWLGVATLAEAFRLREAGVLGVPVLACLSVPGEPYGRAIGLDIDLTAGAPWVVEEAAAAAEEAGRSARVHLKADTGLSRGGAAPGDWPALVEAALKAEALEHLRVVGVYSHFACADEPGHPSLARQLGTFREMVGYAEEAGLRPEVTHLANSLATLTFPESRFDLVRSGHAIYGLMPGPPAGVGGFRPAMTLTADAAMVKRVPAGSGVSYGLTYTTDRETTLALVPAGYADGVPRQGSNLLEVLAGGRRRRIAGRVSMDQFVIDLGGDVLAAGDEVVLFGPGDRGEPTAQEWADALGTISYEIVTRIGLQVPRVYQGGPAGDPDIQPY